MSFEGDRSVTYFFEQLRAGDRSAADELWQRFFPRMVGLARKTLTDYPQRAADAEDAAQDAFVSFWRRAEAGEFVGELDRNNLWNLLGTITVRKALKQARREGAQKRGGGKVHGESSIAGLPHGEGKDVQLDEALAQLPTQEFDLHCEELLLALDVELRAFALLRLMGYKNHEIASILDCSESKVERKLQFIRRSWEAFA